MRMRNVYRLFGLIFGVLLITGCSSAPTHTPLESNPIIQTAPVQTFTTIIAAANASASDKARASYLCPGSGHDETTIQKAINDLSPYVNNQVLLIGDFIKGNAGGISLPSNITITIQGTISLADNINTDASIFSNSDPINGNTGISIREGRLIGNEKHNTCGDQYAVNFTRVTDSEVDCWIEDFRTADELMVDCEINYINRYYNDAYSPRIRTLSKCEAISDFIPSPGLALNSEDFLEGQHSLQISADADQSHSFLTSRIFDLRFHPFIIMKFKVILGTTQHFWAYLYNPRLDIYAPIEVYKYNDDSPNHWKLGLMDISSLNWTDLNTNPSDFLRDVQFRLKLEAREEGTPMQILIDNIYAVRGLNQAVITQVFDDGWATDFTRGIYLQKYGYQGVSGIISTAVGEKNYLTLDQLNSLYQSGWDISNHSYSHLQSNLSTGEQWLQDTAGRGYLEALGFSRSAKYRLDVGNQSELSETDSRKINSARRYMGTNDVWAPSASLPYGYTQQLLNYFGYAGSNDAVKTKISIAKKFHTWQIIACHEITDTPGQYKTPVSTFQGVVDYLHSQGMQVRTLSGVYAQYPLEQEPAVGWTLKEYSVQYHNIQAVDPAYLCDNQDLSGPLPIRIKVDKQPDVSRTLTWAFNSHTNLTAYTLEITGKDAKGITQTIRITEKDGWSGEVSRDLTDVSIELISRTGSGEGDTLDIGIGSKLGLPGKIYQESDVTMVIKNGTEFPSGSYRVDDFYDTVDISGGNPIADGDDFEIWYRSNLNHFSP